MFNFETLVELFLHSCREHAHRPLLLAYPDHESEIVDNVGANWHRFSPRDMRTRVEQLMHGLLSLGVKRGESVGIIATPSPDWLMLDIAIQLAGGVTVPIFRKISPESFRHEITDSRMRILFVGDATELSFVEEHGKTLERKITYGYSAAHRTYHSLLEEGARRAKENPEELERRVRAVKPDDLATIIYTSGSTGLPKGVELTQYNIASQINATSKRFDTDSESDRCISTLPLAHVFERMVVYFYLANGLPIYFVDDPKMLADYVRAVKPTIMTVVPRILEKVYLRMSEKASETSGIKGRLARAGVERARTRTADTRPGLRDRLYGKLVYGKLREGLGGRLRYTICGAAKLPEHIGRFFVNIGIPVYEGYGMTEASPVIACNYPGSRRLGTVGKAFPGVEVRIGEDSEVLARGANVMRRYHKRPDATAEVLDEHGWLHTGDRGSIDEQGFITIEGRKKELFKKSTGEYVPPGPIEAALQQHDFVDVAVIFADNRVHVTALLFPDMEKLAAVKRRLGCEYMSDEDFLRSNTLRADLQSHVDEVNEHRHKSEQIARFELMHHAASAESGDLTPTMKVRRFHIEKSYADIIEQMYAGIPGWK